MAMLFSDKNLSSTDLNLVSYGTKKDVCLFTFREEMIGKPVSDSVKVRRELEGNLERQLVVKFRHSGAEIVISMDYIHKLAEKYPLEVKADESEESE